MWKLRVDHYLPSDFDETLLSPWSPCKYFIRDPQMRIPDLLSHLPRPASTFFVSPSPLSYSGLYFFSRPPAFCSPFPSSPHVFSPLLFPLSSLFPSWSISPCYPRTTWTGAAHPDDIIGQDTSRARLHASSTLLTLSRAAYPVSSNCHFQYL